MSGASMKNPCFIFPPSSVLAQPPSTSITTFLLLMFILLSLSMIPLRLRFGRHLILVCSAILSLRSVRLVCHLQPNIHLLTQGYRYCLRPSNPLPQWVLVPCSSPQTHQLSHSLAFYTQGFSYLAYQFMVVLVSHDLMCFVDGSNPPFASVITSSTGESLFPTFILGCIFIKMFALGSLLLYLLKS